MPVSKALENLKKTRDSIQQKIDLLEAQYEPPCIYQTATDHLVKCKTCGGAKYIQCGKKKMKINEKLCNKQCKDFTSI